MLQSSTGHTPNQFPPVFYARYRVSKLSPVQIDELLANGWFRNDLHVYTTLGRFVENSWRPSVMLRIPLENFNWKKRLKKLLRRNGKRFTVRIRPFEPRDEIDQLWSRFKKEVHNWGLIPDFSFHLFRGVHPGNFNSWEVTVYHDGKLVAFSVFDRGENSLASMEAAYDPAYSKYSLGLYTMLLEIEFGIERQHRYFYPGFLPKDVSMFGYKLRTGGVEFFRAVTGEWLPFENLKEDDWLLLEVLRHLNSVKKHFSGGDLQTSLVVAGGANFPGFVPKASDYNVYLVINSSKTQPAPGRFTLKLAWDPFSREYYLFEYDKQLVERTKSGNAFPAGQAEGYHFTGEFPTYDDVVRHLCESYPALHALLPPHKRKNKQ